MFDILLFFTFSLIIGIISYVALLLLLMISDLLIDVLLRDDRLPPVIFWYCVLVSGLYMLLVTYSKAHFISSYILALE